MDQSATAPSGAATAPTPAVRPPGDTTKPPRRRRPTPMALSSRQRSLLAESSERLILRELLRHAPRPLELALANVGEPRGVPPFAAHAESGPRAAHYADPTAD